MCLLLTKFYAHVKSKAPFSLSTSHCPPTYCASPVICFSLDLLNPIEEYHRKIPFRPQLGWLRAKRSADSWTAWVTQAKASCDSAFTLWFHGWLHLPGNSDALRQGRNNSDGLIEPPRPGFFWAGQNNLSKHPFPSLKFWNAGVEAAYTQKVTYC